MARRKKFEVERENHDRWLVSYADFITLLFAFFVVMYAVSVVNQNKYKQLANSLGSAFGSSKAAQQHEGGDTAEPDEALANGPYGGRSFIRPFAPPPRRSAEWRREREAMTALALTASQTLAPLIERGAVRVVQNNRGIRIDIRSQVLFAAGSAELGQEATTPLLEIARLLADRPNAIEVEGHTDSTPISNGSYYSNWELSAMRASTVVRLLEQHGIASQRLGAVGYGAARPLADNTTEAGRAANRRVAIMVLYGAPAEANDGAEIRAEQSRSR